MNVKPSKNKPATKKVLLQVGLDGSAIGSILLLHFSFEATNIAKQKNVTVNF